MAKYQPGWTLLGQTVKRRRDRLGITQDQVSEAGGPSTATLRLIENAQANDPRSKTLWSLDRALGWQRGSAIGLVEGDIPPGAWPATFDEFVHDLIDYVSDTTRDEYDVPVSPRQRQLETQSGEPPDTNEDDAHRTPEERVVVGTATGSGGGIGISRSRAESPDQTDTIIGMIPELSMDDLDKVITAASSSRVTRARELSRSMGLPWPLRLRHNTLSKSQIEKMSPELHERWLILNRWYRRDHEAAVLALARHLDGGQSDSPFQANEPAVMAAKNTAAELLTLIDQVQGTATRMDDEPVLPIRRKDAK